MVLNSYSPADHRQMHSLMFLSSSFSLCVCLLLCILVHRGGAPILFICLTLSAILSLSLSLRRRTYSIGAFSSILFSRTLQKPHHCLWVSMAGNGSELSKHNGLFAWLLFNRLGSGRSIWMTIGRGACGRLGISLSSLWLYNTPRCL